MLRRLSISAALAALTGPALLLGGVLGPGAAPAHAEPGGGVTGPGAHSATARAGAPAGRDRLETSRRAKRTAAARAEEDTPLSVTIDQLTPSTVPERGMVRVSGTVTNNDTEAWATVNLRPLVSPAPLTSQADLAEAVDTPGDTVIGERINDERYKDFIAELGPGEDEPYSISIPARVLREASPGLAAGTPGVYWFGVHALGESGAAGRDDVADGRARTFLPMVPTAREGSLPTAVVVPLRRQVVYADDGSVEDLAAWTAALSDGGRLRALVDFGASAGDRPVTWLVDPGLVDAVRRLAQGNPGRSLAPNLTSDAEDGEDAPADDPSASDGEAASDPPSPTEEPTEETEEQDGGQDGDEESPLDLDALDPVVQAAADAAQSWLTRLGGAIGPEDEVLSLPYGDVDVAAAAAHDPTMYLRAVARAGTALPGLDVATTPAVASPAGYLSPEGMDLADPGATMLLSDKMFGEVFPDGAPSVAEVGDHRAVVFSTGAGEGGPGPDARTGTVGMRQRLLSEAAVRFLSAEPGQREPLTLLLPPDWKPEGGSTYFGGLDAPWLDLTGVGGLEDATPATRVDPDALRYPGWQEEQELDEPSFAAAEDLVAAGGVLQNLLTLNNLVAGVVTDQALATLSYSARTSPIAHRASAVAARRWIEDRVDRVQVSSARAVTLSSASGPFQATVSNGLDEPVTVSFDALSDDRLAIRGPDRLDVPAGGRQSVLLTASTDENGVHEVTLLLTDKRGTPFGPRTDLTIRSAQVSNVIWGFIGTGAALLFLAIGLRIFRRIREARRTPSDPDPAPVAGGTGDDREPAGAGTR